MSLHVELLATQTVTDEASLAQFLDRLEGQLESLAKTHGQLMFTQYETKKRPDGLAEVEAAQAELMSNPDYQALVSQFQGKVEAPLLARRVEVWNEAFQGARVSARPAIRELVTAISDAIVAFKYDVSGQTYDLGGVRNLLRTAEDRDVRKAAWHSFAPLSEQMAAQTKELFRLRNAAAQEEGFATYAHMQLQAQGLNLEQVTSILEELAVASNPGYQRIMAAGADRFGLGQIQPWDVKFLLEGQSGLPARHFPRDGIIARLQEWSNEHVGSMDELGISVHFMDIPYNGLCMTIHRRDIRILGNPANGHNYYKTSFHELGHALHGAFSDPGSFILRREPSVFNEGMAELLGYTVQDHGWLAHLGLSAAEVEAAGALMMAPWFAYLRQRSAHALFEYQAYANPDGDLDAVNAQIEARLLGCAYDATPRWAAEPNAWFTRYPVYWQNYVLADVIASQIQHDLVRRFGSVWRNSDAIAHIKEYYWTPGGAIDWQEKVRRGTGAPLGTAALVEDLSRF